MVLLFHNATEERLERLSRDVQAINDEARQSSYEMSVVRKPSGSGYEWEVTVYGRKVTVKSEDILKIQRKRLDLSIKDIFKEIVAWKLKALSTLQS
ncbi:hypothetical protein SAMN04487895_1061 [Paenibacillus sophorae]|uniref:Uncharacterized protein n=1 Tax=Paenibacillus sophorae TaxID=1333845 RepID=A0A1H8N1M7_9BACL|nr:hypothetical protein [Paenibacillus sophorae]QWU14831.1 hypothetical protein KP014_23365 [Paenibacillus sophorae]SEO23378.1 hypothetical protein SAMN04487895_1061 [Paenibacillus sophorae]